MRAGPRKTLDANFETSNYFTAVELLIDAASGSEHRSRRGGVALAYINTPIISASYSKLLPQVF